MKIIRLTLLIFLFLILFLSLKLLDGFVTPEIVSSGGRYVIDQVSVQAAFADSVTLVQKREDPLEKKNFIMPRFVRKWISSIVDQQRDIREKVVALARDPSNGRDPLVLIVLLSLCFLYGIVHAAGPGHGKIALCSYVMSPRVGLARGAILGFIIASFHGLSALILVGLSLSGVRALNMHSMDSIVPLQRLSSFMLIGLGILLFIRALIYVKREGPGGITEFTEEKAGHLSNLPFALVIGLVPCSGTLILLLFINAAGIWSLGVPMVIAMIAGMGSTLAVTGALMVLLREGALSPSRGSSRKMQNFTLKSIQLMSPLLLIMIGVALL